MRWFLTLSVSALFTWEGRGRGRSGGGRGAGRGIVNRLGGGGDWKALEESLRVPKQEKAIVLPSVVKRKTSKLRFTLSLKNPDELN